MASGATPAEIREWAAENGFDVPERGRLGSDVKDAYAQAHDTDTGTPDPGGPPASPPEFAADPEPDQRARKGASSAAATAALRGRKPVKVTAAVREDITGKVALLLTLPASAWAARDPWCGPVALDVVPGVSDALADIFCGSPDVVAFFTTAGGDYMKWLKLMTALQPLATTYYRHHIGHTIGQETAGAGGLDGGYVPPDMSSFHAPPV